MSRFAPIAIVGRACVLPGALDPQALWPVVRDGVDLLGPAPADRWGIMPSRILTDSARPAPDRTWSDRGGYVHGFDGQFDADGFELPPDVIAGLDPLFQWVLHTGREALRDARHGGELARAGVVIGNLSYPASAMARYAEAVWLQRLSPVLGEGAARSVGVTMPDARNRFMSGLPAHLLAQALGLGAGAFALDAACASSLYAIKLACDRLHEGSADLMLAGAVNRADDLFLHVGFAALKALSATGRSRPFHPEADGLVPAEGACMFALRRLEDAERDGERVLGVIRGVGLSNDGRGRGLLVPSQAGQVRAVRAALALSGLSPGDIDYVECHATGTTVGDATEIATLHEVFGARGELPIGSFKANAGHLITAAGGAGLLKVLAAMEHAELPPTPHLDTLHPDLADTSLRVVQRREAWDGGAPRRAAVNAFGFGGNNAQLIVEQWQRGAPAVAVPAQLARPPIAIVALGARVADTTCASDFEQALYAGDNHVRARSSAVASGHAMDVELSVRGLRFPPADLQQALPQQLLLLGAAREALSQLDFDPARTGAVVGMQCDPEVARHGARWRLIEWARTWGCDAGWLAEARDGVVPLLGAGGVVGAMPNVVANRLNSQFDLGGPSFTVSSEELSGVRALTVAAGALGRGELDTALVGAVDVCAEEVHERAAAELLPQARRTAGDAAVVLVLKRLDDARAAGHTILAVVEQTPAGAQAELDVEHDVEPRVEFDLELDVEDLAGRFGHAHAASGLLHVAAGALACARRQAPAGVPTRAPREGAAYRVRVDVDALGDQRASVRLRSEGAARVPALSAGGSADGPVLSVAAHRPPPHVPPPRTSAPPPAHMEPAPVLPAVLATGAVPPAGLQTGGVPPADSAHAGMLAPSAPAVAAPSSQGASAVPAAATPAAATPAAATPGSSVSACAPTPMTSGVGAPPGAATAQVVARHVELARALSATHQQFVAQQAAMHTHFLQVRAQAGAGLLGAMPAAAAGTQHEVAAATPATFAMAVAPATAVTATTAATPARAAPPTATTVCGPTFSRAQLQVHASGRISEIFGPAFAHQDAHALQVRMPEPPLLLADRVVGLDAEPDSMGLGTVWTETDVRADSWFLHRGRVPAGILIECGQADLLLISYLGIDRLNAGKRAYRLLGCELTYHGSAPAVGETLHYDIHVDGHANQGDVRLFFFHSDCHVGTRPVMSVRHGQAGFFSEAELDRSIGVLWSAQDEAPAADARVDPAAVTCSRRDFSEAHVRAFAQGDLFGCFGPGFERGQTHTHSPAIQSGDMCFIDRIDGLDPTGGPWGRGYARAVTDIHADDWFFEGHFKNDPCMPGTLMFEGCLQLMAFYLASLGHTLQRDGWRFEPVPEVAYPLQCRGQVLPSSRQLVCEIFVEEVWDGPEPTVFAHLLGTVDGRKAFHARHVGLRLVPDWPLSSRPQLLEANGQQQRAAVVDGFEFGYPSLLACAWGKPSDAFGAMYIPFDGARRVARLPGPPYHFMSRVSEVRGELGGFTSGAEVEIAYDVPPDAWYFEQNGAAVMPFAVLLEAVLQPCGWLASYVGSALTSKQDLSFRNLDGKGTVLRELPRDVGTLRTVSRLTNISRSGDMIIQSFEVTCFAGDDPVYALHTVFGFFPAAALENQVGLPTTDGQRALLTASSDYRVELTTGPERYCGGAPRLASPMLCMLDRVTAFDATGGAAGLGTLRADKDVDPGEWFFKAHFFQDPVQPGSLGIEAMLQLLQFYMLETGMDAGCEGGRFEAVRTGQAFSWKYRGQVVPENRVITTTLEITERGRDEVGPFARGDASLWVDGKRIYEASGLAMRIRSASTD